MPFKSKAQRRKFARRIRVVIGERMRRSDLRARLPKRCKELLRPPDPGEGDHAAPAQRGGRLRLRPQIRVCDRNASLSRPRGDTLASLAAANDDQSVRVRELDVARRAQRTGGNAQAVANAGRAVDHRHAEILARDDGAVLADERDRDGFDLAADLCEQRCGQKAGEKEAAKSVRMGWGRVPAMGNSGASAGAEAGSNDRRAFWVDYAGNLL